MDTYELVIPYDKKYIQKRPYDGIIALDPGGRTMLTGYSPSKHTVEIGSNISGIVDKQNNTMDHLRSIRDKTKNKKKKNMYTKALHRAGSRKKNLKDELHWKTCNFLTRNYETIILGDMSSRSIMSKKSKKNTLNKKSKRGFAFTSFYLFRQRLEYKCISNGNNFIFQNEACTTKTCTRCGDIHSSIGSKKIFNCPNCNLCIDRDENAARNIYLRAYVETLSNQIMSVTSSI